ncbi:MAG: signal recognition particle-docking protein FtsY [Candidatus Nanoarchaeia archaeon]
MFKFLRDKLSGALSKFTKKVEEAPAEEKPEIVEKSIEEKKELKEIKEEKIQEIEVKEEQEERIEEKKEEPVKVEEKKEIVKEKEPPKEEKKGFFAKLTEKVTTTKISESKFNDLFWDLEVALMENNVAVEVIDKIKSDLKKDIVDVPIKRSDVKEVVTKSLKSSIEDLFSQPELDLIAEIKKSDKPYVIVFVGINGSGKTTTIAKFVQYLKDNHLTSVIAASDTFRAAAIHQLEEHGKKLGVKVVKHDYGADPAAVAFDAEKYAKAHNIDVVLIDTAGRMHSNANLIDEMKKIMRVAKPNLKIFVGEAITGNDCVEQAKTFNDAVTLDGIILAKADIDEKGGAAISISYVTGKPIMFLGVGQNYGDLEKFDSSKIVKSLGL